MASPRREESGRGAHCRLERVAAGDAFDPACDRLVCPAVAAVSSEAASSLPVWRPDSVLPTACSEQRSLSPGLDPPSCSGSDLRQMDTARHS